MVNTITYLEEFRAAGRVNDLEKLTDKCTEKEHAKRV